MREYMQAVLGEDYHIVTAENGKVAWEKLNGKLKMENGELPDPTSFSILNSQFPIDLIISDLMMPVMDGFQLLEKIKAEDALRHIPVIMLTARADVRVKLRALRIGVDDYLTKPFQEEELKARIENLLRNYRERMAMFSQMRKEGGAGDGTRPVIAAVDAEWLLEVEAVFTKHLTDSRLSVDFAAGKLNLSERQFHRRIKELTGLTPNQYLQEIRLQRAKDLLVEGKFATVKEVSFAVGFQDIRYFSDLFEKHFGAKPSEMRK
jgi:DNA-binding response OmpR family regulator